MAKAVDPFRFVLIAVAGWMNHVSCRPSSTCAKIGESGSLTSNVAGRRPRRKGYDERYSRKWLRSARGYTTELASNAGVASVTIPPRSPLLNVHPERFVRTIKESCPERLILFGEGSIRKVTAEFVCYYHVERNHQGLGNQLISPEALTPVATGQIARRERPGG
jgi:putative transposase